MRHPPLLVLASLLCAVLAGTTTAGTIAHVIHISVDGLRPDALTQLGAKGVPHFWRLRTEGAGTDQGRSDSYTTETLPNHVTQLTSRGARAPDGTVGAAGSGHDWTLNVDPGLLTLAANKGSYVAGVFDVVHAAGKRTGLYATKPKFTLFVNSWSKAITHSLVTNYKSAEALQRFLADSAAHAQTYTFLHVVEPDMAGHGHGWMSPEYLQSVQTVDGYLGQLFTLIAATPELKNTTAIMLTADHAGGDGTGTSSNHGDARQVRNCTIPFYVWGPGVKAGADLYQLNRGRRAVPGDKPVPYTAAPQPIRNGEAGNLALKLLGLGPIPGSWLNQKQDLAVQ